MSSFNIVIKGIKNEADSFESMSNTLEKHYDSIGDVRKNLSDVLGSGYSSINSTLGTVMDQIQKEQKSCLAVSRNLEAIAQTYIETEKGLISNYVIKSIIDSEIEIGNGFSEKITYVLKEAEDTLKQLAKKLGLSFVETAAFINDLIKLIGSAGFEALFGEDTYRLHYRGKRYVCNT